MTTSLTGTPLTREQWMAELDAIIAAAPEWSLRHLGPGPHPNGTPQSVHGGGPSHAYAFHRNDRSGKGLSTMPAGWTEYDPGDPDLAADMQARGTVALKHEGGHIMMAVDPQGLYGEGADITPERREQARKVAYETAAALGAAYEATPIQHDLIARVVRLDTEEIGGYTQPAQLDVTVLLGMSTGVGSRVTINGQLFDGSSPARDMARAAGFNGTLTMGAAADPVRAIITHEYGHVVANDRGFIALDGRVPQNGTGTNLMGVAKKRWGDLSYYGMSEPAEAYAELFADWTLRNINGGPTTAATKLAKLEGWG